MLDRYIEIFIFYRDVFLEKHWKSVIHRSICDYFFEAQSKVFISWFCSNTPPTFGTKLQASWTGSSLITHRTPIELFEMF